MSKRKKVRPIFAIGRFYFHNWEGSAPQLPRQHVSTFTRAGVAGIATRLEGVRAAITECTLTTYLPSIDYRSVLMPAYQSLIGADPVEVWHLRVRYKQVHQVLFAVIDCDEVECRAARVVGPGINYANGARLVTRWRLVAHPL